MKSILTILMLLAVTSTSSIAGFRTGDVGSSGGGNGFSIKAGNSNFYDNYSDDPATDPIIKDTPNKAIKPALKASSVVKKADAPVQKKPTTTIKKVQKVIAEDGSVSYSWDSLQQTKTSSEKEIVKLLAVATNSDPNSSQGFNGRKTQLKQSQWASQFIMFPQDENGWSIIKPQVDSRIIYVSSSDGNDSKAQAYFSKDIDNPHNPSKKIIAFKTIEKAMKLIRDGYPDWVLLKKGDKWQLQKTIYLPSGKSSVEPLVISSYGSSNKRPLINTGLNSGFSLAKFRSYIAIIGLEFYANYRDPNSNDFVGWDRVTSSRGFSSVAIPGADSVGKKVESILIEDNIFNFFAAGMVIDGKFPQKNIIIRRNQILNSYSISSHAQGIYTSTSSILFEENLFDHNGWYQQNYESLNSKTKGQAAFYNHSIYASDMFDTVMTGNIFSRSSSMGIKLTSNSDSGKNTIKVENIIIKDNLFLEGEIGISAGGNQDFNNGFRWRNMSIIDNVMLHIGNAQPTRRALAWHIDVQDWDGGIVDNNYLLYNDNPKVTGVYGIQISGFTRNVAVTNNVVRSIGGDADKMIYKVKNETLENITISQNITSMESSSIRLDLNSYFGLSSVLGNSVKYLVDRAKTQSKDSWNRSYTASVINKYLRED